MNQFIQWVIDYISIEYLKSTASDNMKRAKFSLAELSLVESVLIKCDFMPTFIHILIAYDLGKCVKMFG